MKRSTKRLVSLLICLAMALTILPVAAFAAGTTTVYCQAPAGWTNCIAYWWGSSSENPDWPGNAMTQDADGIWYYEVPSDATGLIFNNGTGTQTSDLTVPTDENVMYVFANSTWTVYGKVEVPVQYFVAGSGALCGVEWNPSAAENKMTETNGIYSITYTGVAAGSYELKVTNGSWDSSWGEAGTTNNYVLTVADDDSTVVVSFDPTTELVSVEVNPVTEPDIPGDETLIAEGTATFATAADAWGNPDQAEFVPAADGTVKIEIIACDPGYFVELWADDEWIEDYVGDGAKVIEVFVTAGVTYGFDISSGIDSSMGTDKVAGSVTYKITADVAAGEPSQGGDNPGEGGGSSELDPLPVPEFGANIDAGETVWFIYDNYEHMVNDGVYSMLLQISSSAPYAVTYREMDVPVDSEGFVSYEMYDMQMQGTYVFSITNNGADRDFFSIAVIDRPAYIVSDYTLALGDNVVVPDPNYTNTLYEFSPEQTGVYTFTISDGFIGNWNTVFNPQDNTGTKDTLLQWTCTAEGQDILIGVAQTEEAVLTVARTGDYVEGDQIAQTLYENVYDFSYQLPENPDLVAIDVLDDKADVAVLDDDGFYRYGSAYGPLMVADLNEFPVNLADAYINGQLKAYIYDANGKLVTKYDYNEAMNEYLEAGLVPVTEELATMLKQVGDHHGWWKVGGFVFEEEAPSDEATAWMTACSYIKGSELQAPSGGNNQGGNNQGGNNNQGSSSNPKTADISMTWAFVAIILAGTCLVVLKKKEAFFVN